MIQRTSNAVSEQAAQQTEIARPSPLATARSAPRWKQLAPAGVQMLSDTVALAGALGAATLITNSSAAVTPGAPLQPLFTVLALPLILASLVLSGVYASPVSSSVVSVTVRVAGVVSFGAMLVGTALLLWASSLGPITYLVLAWTAAVLFIPAGRVLTGPFIRLLEQYDIGRRRIMVIGTAPDAQAAARALRANGTHCQLAGLIELPPQTTSGQADGGTWLYQRLQEIEGNCQFLLSAPSSKLPVLEEAVKPLLPAQAQIYLDLAALTQSSMGSQVSVISQGLPAVRLRPRHDSWEYDLVKRGIDLLVAVTALVVAAPLMLVIALAIKADSVGNVVFEQKRVGRRGRVFSMYKFRSMRIDAEQIQADLMDANEAHGPMFKIRNDPRMTRVGKIIRRLSLDELPQLVNVLRGDMSMVGPRPPLPQEVMRYETWQLRRLELLPGITGLWQVCRTDTSSFDEMIQMDLDYIDRWSLALDLKILAGTLPAMVLAKGAY